jgi:uncharacterized protein YydD (DUF2326 family)
MIHRIYSDHASFKELSFHPGLNILLADMSRGATEQQTRNAAGKTSVIELIHFLTCAKAEPSSIFRSTLKDWTFGMEFDVGQDRADVRRTGQSFGSVIVVNAQYKNWIVSPHWDKTLDADIISREDWCKVLGSQMFGLENMEKGRNKEKYIPKFRQLFSYFVRREASGAFRTPEKQSDQQQTWDQQVALMYLLGLDWTIANKLQRVRDQESNLKNLKRLIGEGVLEEIIGTAAKLRTTLTVYEERTSKMRESVEKFQVLPQYHNFEREATRITEEMGQISNENIIDQETILELEQSMISENPPSFYDLECLYKEVGVILPTVVTKRFDDLKSFHRTVIENRKKYLAKELEEARRRMDTREKRLEELSKRHTEIMSLLQSKGALEQYNKLHRELSKLEVETETYRKKFQAAEQLESRSTQLDVERGKIQSRLQQDFQDRSAALNDAILTFQNISSSLYDEAGSLIIGDSDNGPRIEFAIQGKSSKGINNMQIFCFDMMLMKLWSEKGKGPGFLVHDSHLFDGTDIRQVKTALTIGKSMAEKHGFQYIVTMNSDVFNEMDFDAYFKSTSILQTRLTDATDDGGLFGIRF